MALLKAVADGRVVRGDDATDTSYWAAYLLDGEVVRRTFLSSLASWG